MSNLGYDPGQMGWVVPDTHSEQQMLDAEKRYLEKAMDDFPIAYHARERAEVMPIIAEKWVKFQADRGRFAGSQDFTLLDEFIFGKSYTFLPQPIGSCFPAGTLIRMADGSQRPIEAIRPFDQVLTAEGNVSWVSQVAGREVSEEIYEVKLWGHLRVRMTEEHPLLTKRGYIKASELRIDDYVAIPKYAPNTAQYLHTSAHHQMTAQQIRTAAKHPVGSRSVAATGHSVGRERRVARVYRTIPEVIKMTEEFGWICGTYLAEGGCDGNKLVWTWNINEASTHAAKLVKLLKDLYGIEASLHFQQTRNTCKVSIHSTIWAQTFKSLFGDNGWSKRLHPDIASGNEAFLKGLLQGWLDGDGHRNDDLGLWVGTTVSKSLALDMFNISHALGMLPSLQTTDPKVSHGVKSRCRRYDLYIRDARKPMQAIVEEKCVWRRVQGLEKVQFEGRVYNFEVSGDNSYVADSIGVHNCVFSNSFRPWVAGALYQIALLGQSEEFTGTAHLGPNSIAPFCVSYGFARQRANMRSGDGLYCKPMQESYLKDGIVLCSTPKVRELMQTAGATSDNDYPEPRSERLYRSIGNWAWNNDLRPYTSCRMLDAPIPANMDEFNRNIDAGRPMFQCSMIAVRKTGQHRDGFPIHGIDPNNQWAHNMGIMGRRVASNGDRFVIVCNTSWLQPGGNPEAYLYNIPEQDFARSWFPKIDIGVIGDIDGIQSLPANI